MTRTLRPHADLEHDPRSPAGRDRDRLAAVTPWYAQRFISRFTGKAVTGEAVPKGIRPIPTWLGCIAQLLITPVLMLKLLEADHRTLMVLPIAWLLTTNALRRLLVAYAHYSIHGEMAATPAGNRAIQSVSSTLAFVHNFEDYHLEHVLEHHSRGIFITDRDPDAAFLRRLGFVPGLAVGDGWRLLAATVISPQFHWNFLKARIRTNLVTCTWPRRVLSIGWLAMLAVLACSVPFWAFALVVLVPLLPLYHVSSLLQFLSEHPWMSTAHPARTRDEYAAGCLARFALTPLPAAGLTGGAAVLAWLRWSAHMAFVEVPWRYGVLVGDLTVHDFHHLYQAERRWWIAVWLRQAAIDGGDPGHLASREAQGPKAAIDRVLLALSTSPLADDDITNATNSNNPTN